MKPRLKSLPERIRAIRKDLHHWMALRQPNPIMGRDNLQEAAERESLRLAGILDRLETQQREQMAAIEAARAAGRLFMTTIVQLGKDQVSLLDPPNAGFVKDKSGREWRIGRTGSGNIMLRSPESHPDFLPDGMDLQTFCQWINNHLR